MPLLHIAHRGASGYAPENTIAAFSKAMQMGADGIELDVHCAKDGTPMVIHDETVDRTTKAKGRVDAMTTAELKGLGIPTLVEAFEVVGVQAHVFVEVKKAADALAAAQEITRYVAKGFSKLWLISFAHEGLKAALAKYPNLMIGASFDKPDTNSVASAKALGAHAILPLFHKTDAQLVAQAHAAGLKTIVWTVNEPADIAQMRAIGVDGIIGDYPDRLRAV